MKSKSAATRTRALGERLSALMVVSALIVAPAACGKTTPDAKSEQQTAAKADPAAPVDAGTPATAADANATPANPCAPKAKKKPRNPCE